ncbi:FAD-binding protein [Palleronia caenipelagi]|uniref:FAD-binding protein n=1 Tax=Palleronia caenipelagi TaxID=2489174 RepID=A0A547Q2I5_9RHOB|nr:FAD-binding protein [Palleronia caenipelagi]TRD20600.1 FAD-binding protein [Palleronia caenipelagi]
MRPESEAELADVLRSAEGSVAIRGGRTRAPAELPEGLVISTAGLSGIRLYEPGALTLVAGAGTPLAEIEAALTAEGQRLAFEPWDASVVLGRSGRSTLGGVIATNASGPRRIVAGAARDAALGVRLVDGAGEVIRAGGRVMKNVTGVDLVRLACGSRGTLGVITEVSLKTQPGPADAATLVAEGLSPGAAVAAMQAALGTAFEVNGAAHDPARGETALRLEGSALSVELRAERLTKALAGHGDWHVERGRDWARVRDAADLAGSGDLWRISVRSSDAADLVALLPGRWLMDWGGGLIWAEAPAGTDLRQLMSCAGHATLVRATPETHGRLGTLHPESAGVQRLSDGIAARFDPRGLFRSAA